MYHVNASRNEKKKKRKKKKKNSKKKNQQTSYMSRPYCRDAPLAPTRSDHTRPHQIYTRPTPPPQPTKQKYLLTPKLTLSHQHGSPSPQTPPHQRLGRIIIRRRIPKSTSAIALLRYHGARAFPAFEAAA